MFGRKKIRVGILIPQFISGAYYFSRTYKMENEIYVHGVCRKEKQTKDEFDAMIAEYREYEKDNQNCLICPLDCIEAKIDTHNDIEGFAKYCTEQIKKEFPQIYEKGYVRTWYVYAINCKNIKKCIKKVTRDKVIATNIRLDILPSVVLPKKGKGMCWNSRRHV